MLAHLFLFQRFLLNMSKYDLVDVHISSTKSIVDAILEHPILDGTKKYSVEVTEFSVPLSTEGPLPSNATFARYADSMFLFRVRRKVVGQPPINNNTLLSHLPANAPDDLGPKFQETFIPDSFRAIRTPNDLVFYLQHYFDEIKQIYGTSTNGLIAAAHGGGNNVTAANMLADSFVKVLMTPNGTIRLYFSQIFAKHFFIQSTTYATKLFGLSSDIIAFRDNVAGGYFTGILALTNNTFNIVAGETDETVVLQCNYPLTRLFDHRVRLEIDSGGMPVPSIVNWTTDNKQTVRHTLATFPINQKYDTSISLNTFGVNTGDISFTSNLFLGDMTWRRAENKISERFEILNSQFFQNIRLEVFMIRRDWVINPAAGTQKFKWKRRALTLADGESWSAKLRFRTFK
jgi:hypothetical protein